MIYYPNKSPRPTPLARNDRQFIVPFLLGGLAGGAAVGLTRPRPIVNAAPYAAPYYGAPYNYNPYYPAGSYSYSYYVPNTYQ